MKLQKAVKQETVSVARGTAIGCVVLILIFLVFYLIFPQTAVKFDYRVVLGALCGGAVAVANFFLMAVTVQNVVNVTNREDALRMMKVSYRNRMLMRGIWIIPLHPQLRDQDPRDQDGYYGEIFPVCLSSSVNRNKGGC